MRCVKQVVLSGFCVLLSLFPGSAVALGKEGEVAAEVERLKATLAEQSALLTEQAEEMQRLRQQVDELLAGRGASEEDVSAIVEKIIEEQQADKKGGLFSRGGSSLKGEWWKLGGKLEFEFLDSQKDRDEVDVTTSDREADGASSFQIDKLVLKPEMFFNDDITMTAVIEFAEQGDGKESSVNVDEAYLTWKHFLEYLFVPQGKDPTNTWLMVGDMNYFEKTWKPGKRRTENWDLVASTFYRDDDIGIRIGGDLDLHPLFQPFWYVQLSNGNRIDDRSPMDCSGAYEMLVYDESNLDYNNHKMWRGGVGNSMDLDKAGTLEYLAWFSNQDLDMGNDIGGKIDDVVGFLAEYPDPEVNADVYGLIASYTLGDFQFVTQFATGPISNLDIDTVDFRPSYKIHLPGIERGGRKFFTSLELVYSYSRYQLKNLQATPVDARTWDREKHIIAALLDVTKNIQLKMEYAAHEEDVGTGGHDVENNEFLTQLSIAF